MSIQLLLLILQITCDSGVGSGSDPGKSVVALLFFILFPVSLHLIVLQLLFQGVQVLLTLLVAKRAIVEKLLTFYWTISDTAFFGFLTTWVRDISIGVYELWKPLLSEINKHISFRLLCARALLM